LHCRSPRSRPTPSLGRRSSASFGLLHLDVEVAELLPAAGLNRGGTVAAIEFVEYTPDVLKRYPEAAALLRSLLAERGLAVPASTQPGR
jgi:hypothetical protein